MGQITQLEFNEDDFKRAESIARFKGYGDSTAYTSTSDLIGLYCLPDGKQYKRGLRTGCVIKTAEFGFMFVQIEEDLIQ